MTLLLLVRIIVLALGFKLSHAADAGVWRLTQPTVPAMLLTSDHLRITMKPGKRSGKPCIRGIRITVFDMSEYLAAGRSVDEILSDFPELSMPALLVPLSVSAGSFLFP
jgi:uncharacterized protein (DUF433 family)